MAKTTEADLQSKDSIVSMALGLAVILVVGLVAFNYFSNKSQPDAGKTDGEVTQEGEMGQRGAPEDLPTTHTISEDETLWSISERYYNTGYNYHDIREANNLTSADYIQAGQSITIPVVTPLMPIGEVSGASTMAQDAPKQESYTVAEGDYLWKIAVDQYNDGYRWVDIANTNNLMNPNHIEVGQVLQLPQ